VQAAAAGQITAAQVQANVATAAAQYVQQVARLQQAGARTVVVLNLYNLGQAPLGTSQPAAPFTALTGLFNSTLQSGLDQLGGNVVRVDVQGLFLDMLAHPSAYGFTNTGAPACTTASSLQCTTTTLVAPGAASTFLFADGLHPTPAAHLAMAQVVDAMLTAPFKAGTLTEGPLAVEQATFRTVDDRMWSALGTPYDAQRGMTFWAAYDYANPDLDTGFAGGDADLHTISVGGDMRLSPHVLAGAAANFSTFKAHYAGGRHELEETSGTIYAGWGNGPWYAGISALVGTLDYSDVSRTFDLGIAQRTEGGDTGGTHWGVRVHGGYWMQAGALTHGPFAKLVWQRADVDAFAEAGGTSTALRYAEQVRKSLIGSLGWQAQGSFGAVRPFGRVTWEHEFKDDARDVAASPIGLGGTYAMTLPRPDSDWALVHVGAAMDFGAPSATFGKVTGFLAATATAGKDDGDSWGLTLGLRVPF
jgi:outer membrane lipase/esterase